MSLAILAVPLASIATFARRAALTVLVVMFGLQFIRIIFPLLLFYLHITKGLRSFNLGPLTLLIFALTFLALPLVHYVGLRRALVVTAGGVILLRLGEQLSFNPGLDLILAGGGVALSLMVLPLLLSTMSKPGSGGSVHFGLMVLLGVAADNALHSALTTYDLSWRAGIGSLLFVVGLAIIGVLALSEHLNHLDPTGPGEGSWPQMMALAGLGAWLFLQLVVFQNVARLSVASGWPLPLAGLAIATGNLLVLLIGAQISCLASIGPTSVSSVLLIGALLLPEETGLLGLILHLLGQVSAAGLILLVFNNLDQGMRIDGVRRTVVATGVGALLLAILVFAYYLVFEMRLGYRSPAVLPVAGAILVAAGIGSAWSGIRGDARRRPPANLAPAGLGLLLLLLPLGRLITWQQPETITPEPTNNKVRVMSYNLHMGFNEDGRLDLETLAQIIEQSGADVVALQEVSRGWVIAGSVDMLEWLSQRLGMPYVNGPTSGPQWGNAILSRFPFEDVGGGLYPPDDLPVRRGYMRIELDLGREPIGIYNTHLHHIGRDVRRQQAEVLLRVWDNQRRTIIVGDFNAGPNAPELARLPAEGLINAAAIIGPKTPYTWPADDPVVVLDYIWLSSDLLPTEFDIIQSTASDHLPLVATITVP